MHVHDRTMIKTMGKPIEKLETIREENENTDKNKKKINDREENANDKSFSELSETDIEVSQIKDGYVTSISEEQTLFLLINIV